MIKSIKQYFCKHRYKLLTNYKKDIDLSGGYKLKTICVLYCPKCKKQIEVLEHEHNTIIERQLVDEEFNKKP